jgi:hypothetical protein
LKSSPNGSCELFSPQILSLLVLHLCSEVYLFQKQSGIFTNFANLNLLKSMQILFQTNAFFSKTEKEKWFEKKGRGGTNRPRPTSGPGPASPPVPNRYATDASRR